MLNDRRDDMNLIGHQLHRLIWPDVGHPPVLNTVGRYSYEVSCAVGLSLLSHGVVLLFLLFYGVLRKVGISPSITE